MRIVVPIMSVFDSLCTRTIPTLQRGKEIRHSVSRGVFPHYFIWRRSYCKYLQRNRTLRRQVCVDWLKVVFCCVSYNWAGYEVTFVRMTRIDSKINRSPKHSFDRERWFYKYIRYFLKKLVNLIDVVIFILLCTRWITQLELWS